MVYYLLTIHKSQKLTYVETELLDALLDVLDMHFVEVLASCLEFHGKYQQLHAHALIRANKYFKYSNLTKIAGCQLHWQRISDTSLPNLKNIVLYIDKWRHYGCAYINYCKVHYLTT